MEAQAPKTFRTPLEIIQGYIDTFEDMQKGILAAGDTAHVTSLGAKIHLLKTIMLDIEVEQEAAAEFHANGEGK